MSKTLSLDCLSLFYADQVSENKKSTNKLNGHNNFDMENGENIPMLDIRTDSDEDEEYLKSETSFR